MKKINIFLIGLVLSASTISAEWASIYDSMIAFDETPGLRNGNRPGYVKPIITQLGTVLNGNWVSSANVPQSFSFDAGLPITLSFIADADRTYSAAQTPTIFGADLGSYNYNSNIPCSTTPLCNEISGNENLHNLSVFSYPIAQAGLSYYHARVVLRGMWLPPISELRSFSLFGFGLQYSFGYLFQYALPKNLQTLNVSLAYGRNSSFIGYTPDNYTGQLDLGISTNSFQMVVGYSPARFVELMLSIGYETAYMKSGGALVSGEGANILPSLAVNGSNGFRLGLEVAFSLGDSFHPVVGGSFGTRTAINANILYFKQTFGKDPTPEEIAAIKMKNRKEKIVPAPLAPIDLNAFAESDSESSEASED